MLVIFYIKMKNFDACNFLYQNKKVPVILMLVIFYIKMKKYLNNFDEFSISK